MTDLHALIAQYCPSGVPMRSLGDVGEFLRGNGLQKKDFVEDGFPCIHYGQIYTYYGTSAVQTKSFVDPDLAVTLKQARPGDLVVTTTSENVDDVCTAVAWLGETPVAIGGHSCVYSHTLDPMYAAYYFQTRQFHDQKRRYVSGTKVKDIKASDLAQIVIPVPPLQVQQEISSILSSMEQLEAELETELEAELEARYQQYAYYRSHLFAFDGRTDVAMVPLGELGTFTRGRRFVKTDMQAAGLPCVHYGEIYTHYGISASQTLSYVNPLLRDSLRFADPGDLIIAGVGETVEDVGKSVAWLGEGPVAFHDDSFAYKHSLDPRFVSHFFRTPGFHEAKARNVARAKVKRISAQGLAAIPIPVPNRSEQSLIADTLDRFDNLVNDISSSLPAEIAARRKQYEYYRDRLLTFHELAS